MNDIFVEAVKERIQHFNETRGRRKGLAPNIVERIPMPYKKFGLILDFGDEEASEITSKGILRMAGATVRTLLRRKPRPSAIALDMFRYDSKYQFRLVLPRINRSKN